MDWVQPDRSPLPSAAVEQPMTETSQPALEARDISKRFGGVQALSQAHLTGQAGTVHALVGQNGAGKSTLMKILVGAYAPDNGQILVDGKVVSFRSIADARRAGISIVFQELSLYPQIDVLTNLSAGDLPTRLGTLDRREMRKRAAPILQRLGLEIDLDALVGMLTLAEQQTIEIAQALMAGSRILILDEPNSALNATETARLFAIVQQLKERGVAIVFVSHRLEEVFEISDEITVLRNGSVVVNAPTSALSMGEVVRHMTGREVPKRRPERGQGPGASDQALGFEAVSATGAVMDVSFRAGTGEIVGLAGLEGSGSQDVLKLVFGLITPDHGRITMPGGASAATSVRAAVRSGVAYVPPDRRTDGLMLARSIAMNIGAVTAGALGSAGFMVRDDDLAEGATEQVTRLGIVASSTSAPTESLSGGNQQKVLLAKWLSADPKVVLLNDPTRGVDVGSKDEIYRIIQEVASEGRVVLFSSSEAIEYLGLCDRILIFYRGQLRGELPADAWSEHGLLSAINTGNLDATATRRPIGDPSGGALEAQSHV